MKHKMRKSFFGKCVESYVTCAILLFTTSLLFVLLNLVAYMEIRMQYRLTAAHTDDASTYVAYGEDRMVKAYPGLSKEDIKQLLREHMQEQEFETYTQYKDRTFAGKWVNVDENGFRRTKNQGPWPPNSRNLNVFLFGGSTALGHAVPDDHTIASWLQDYLQSHSKEQVSVYNFARRGYYSTQERILFEKLLVAGFVPSVAIFIDGLNDCYFWNDIPEYTDRLKAAMDAGHADPQVLQTVLSALPVMKVIRRIPTPEAAEEEYAEWLFAQKREAYKDRKVSAGVVERYSRTRRLIAAASSAFGVKPLFVVQPTPSYKYDLKYHLFAKNDSLIRGCDYTKFVYPIMAKAIQERPQDYSNNFLWLADIQEGRKESLYVDGIHYSSKFSKELAARIGRFLLE